MRTEFGDKTIVQPAPIGFFTPGTDGATEAGMELVRDSPSAAAIKQMLKDGSYGIGSIAFKHPPDPLAL